MMNEYYIERLRLFRLGTFQQVSNQEFSPLQTANLRLALCRCFNYSIGRDVKQ